MPRGDKSSYTDKQKRQAAHIEQSEKAEGRSDAAAERIATAAGLDLGGIEYLVDDRDGTRRFFDINALSNFVASPLDVLGWDPHDRLAAWLGQQVALRQAA